MFVCSIILLSAVCKVSRLEASSVLCRISYLPLLPPACIILRNPKNVPKICNVLFNQISRYI